MCSLYVCVCTIHALATQTRSGALQSSDAHAARCDVVVVVVCAQHVDLKWVFVVYVCVCVMLAQNQYVNSTGTFTRGCCAADAPRRRRGRSLTTQSSTHCSASKVIIIIITCWRVVDSTISSLRVPRVIREEFRYCCRRRVVSPTTMTTISNNMLTRAYTTLAIHSLAQ